MYKRLSSGVMILLFIFASLSADSEITLAARQFPRSIDPYISPQVSELTQLTPEDLHPEDRFGFSSAVGDNTLVIGSPGADPYETESGMVYVYETNPVVSNDWLLSAQLTQTDPAMNDQFGWTVAIDGDTIAVGAYTKVPGGAVYIFERDQNVPHSWEQTAKVVGLDTNFGDGFGVDVDLSGDYLVVGQYAGGDYAGSIYIFERNHGGANSWGQIANLKSSDNSAYDYFGYTVAIDGDVVVAGAPGNDGLTGAAYVFELDLEGSGEWIEVAQLIASDAALQNYFGIDLYYQNNVAVIGAIGHNEFAGAAYIFEQTGLWEETTILQQQDSEPGDHFGGSVSISGEKIIVGAYGDDDYTGSATIYHPSLDEPGLWQEQVQLRASNGQPGDGFAGSICIGETFVLVGASGVEPGGSAYVYSLVNTPPDIIDLGLSANPVEEKTPLYLHADVVDPDIDELLTANVDWGDGLTDTVTLQGDPITYTLDISHTYQQGSLQYTITVSVVDLAQANDQITTTVTVQEDFLYVYIPYLVNKR